MGGGGGILIATDGGIKLLGFGKFSETAIKMKKYVIKNIIFNVSNWRITDTYSSNFVHYDIP